MAQRTFGEPIKRLEDPRLVSGDGKYVDDIGGPETLAAAFVRSPYAHASIVDIDVSGALDERSAPQPIRDAVSALINRGYAQPQAAAAIAAATREAGDGADTARLIRLGLKELAK